MGKLRDYTVRWEIEVSASNKRAAAKKARKIQQNPQNEATFYDVKRFEEADDFLNDPFVLIDLGVSS